MITQQAQVKINLPLALKEFLESKAMKFDMPIAGYIKHLILKDVADMDFPVFAVSGASEKKAERALSQISKATKVGDVRVYLKSL